MPIRHNHLPWMVSRKAAWLCGSFYDNRYRHPSESSFGVDFQYHIRGMRREKVTVPLTNANAEEE